MAKKLMAITLLVSFAAIPVLPVLPSANAANTITVFAASSLTDSFTQLGERFERAHPGVKIRFSFQASSTLLNQIKSGAPADIFVSAEPIANGKDYLINRVVLAIPRDSKIERISDLNGNFIWIQCAHEVPCGQAADAALSGEGVKSSPASLEPKVTSVVSKLLAGEVDAAIIYRTDVIANSKKIKSIEFTNRKAASTIYQTVQLRKRPWIDTFNDFLRSRSTLKYLQSRGFEIK